MVIEALEFAQAFILIVWLSRCDAANFCRRSESLLNLLDQKLWEHRACSFRELRRASGMSWHKDSEGFPAQSGQLRD